MGGSQLRVVHVVCCSSCIVLVLKFNEGKPPVLARGVVYRYVDVLDIPKRYESRVQHGIIDALFQSCSVITTSNSN